MYLECIQMTEDIDWLQLENTVSWLGFHMKKNRREKLPEGPIFLFQQTVWSKNACLQIICSLHLPDAEDYKKNFQIKHNKKKCVTFHG